MAIFTSSDQKQVMYFYCAGKHEGWDYCPTHHLKINDAIEVHHLFLDRASSIYLRQSGLFLPEGVINEKITWRIYNKNISIIYEGDEFYTSRGNS